MARKEPLLTDEQWQKIEPLLPPLPPQPKGGRPWRGHREVLEGLLWILRTGAPWRDLPEQYPSASTCWRRLAEWEETGLWEEIWRTFLGELDEQGLVDWSESFADASFAPAKKGALQWGLRGVGRAQSGWWWSTARAFLSESTWRRPRHTKPPCSKPRSTRRTVPSASDD
jgi:transposase